MGDVLRNGDDSLQCSRKLLFFKIFIVQHKKYKLNSLLNVTGKVKTEVNKYFKKRENYGKLPLKNKKRVYIMSKHSKTT